MAEHNLGYGCSPATWSGAARRPGRARGARAGRRGAGDRDQDRAEVLLAAGLVEEGTAALAWPCARPMDRRPRRRREAEAELALARGPASSTPRRPATARRASRRFAAGRAADSWIARAERWSWPPTWSWAVRPSSIEAAEQLADLDREGLRWPDHAPTTARRRRFAARSDVPGPLRGRCVRARTPGPSGRSSSAARP